MTSVKNPFIKENQNLHSFIPRSRINLIEELLFYLRRKKGIFKVFSQTGTGGSFILSQIYKLLSTHENVFYIDGKKIKNIRQHFQNQLNMDDPSTEKQIAEKINAITVKGKHSIFLLEHFEKFESVDFIFFTNLIKEIKNIKLLILGHYDKVNILSKNLKIPTAYSTTLNRLSFFESVLYLRNRFQNIDSTKSLDDIVHTKTILFIAFISHGKPQILNKIANQSLQVAIEKNNLPLTFRQTLMSSFKFKMITYPFFPIQWGITLALIIFLIISYLFYLPMSRSIEKFQEEKVKQLIDRDINNFISTEHILSPKADISPTTPSLSN